MTSILPWATLAVCLLMAVARIPSAIRGENRVLFYLFSLITLDILLSIEGPYLAIDSWLGGFNLTNLLLRFLLYGTFLLLGIKLATGFGSPAGVRAITGGAGLAVLAIVAALTAWFFLVTDTRGSTVGLTGLQGSPSLEAYAALGRLYPGYVAVCLMPGIWRTVAGAGPLLLRGTSGLLLLGLLLLVSSQIFPLIPTENAWLLPLINYSAALATVLGLGGIWLSKAYYRRKSHRDPGFSQKY
ncbi:hypothetical protein [Arthrobacter cavernae]|uniref:Uncharacterized protein n=1 Tax=Arthrobacter cavernae TaxID=2817681 RepID=A0A939HGE6_9MICC|nr:hypothetical protein [Arthrobacter cavernae]MBO1267517.1 hypothetical protein [Arthrobacter cavernae]